MGRRVSGCLLASRGLSLNRSAFTTGGGDLSKTGLSSSQDKRMKTRLSLDIRQLHWGTGDQRRMRTKLPLHMADAGFWEWPLPPKGVESQESRIPFLTASRSASCTGPAGVWILTGISWWAPWASGGPASLPPRLLCVFTSVLAAKGWQAGPLWKSLRKGYAKGKFLKNNGPFSRGPHDLEQGSPRVAPGPTAAALPGTPADPVRSYRDSRAETSDLGFNKLSKQL